MESRYYSELSGVGFCLCFTLWNCPCGICSLLSVLCWTTGIHLFVTEWNLRLLDCFFSSSLGLWDLSQRRHAIANNLVDELRLSIRDLLVFMWGQIHHLRRSLSKSTAAHAHQRSVRRFTLAWASSANNRLRWCSRCYTPHYVAPLRVANSESFFAQSFDVFPRIRTASPSSNN